MRAVSLFSGVGGFELGFERTGIETVLQAERDAWCLQVLARHWPQTERVTDVRDVGVPDAAREFPQQLQPRDERGDVDLVYGGFPCQDLSVAGKRAGLGGERSGEWFEFERVLRELRPRWVVVENVPGLLSSGSSAVLRSLILVRQRLATRWAGRAPRGHSDRVLERKLDRAIGAARRANAGIDFRVVVAGLLDLGYRVGWTVLDARYFGVPQRRRRVFIVAGPRGRGPEQVLSLCESCGGHPETGEATREGTTGSLSAGTLRAGGVNGGNNPAGGYLADVAVALTASAGRHGHASPRGDGASNLIPDVAWALQERDAKGPDSDTKDGHLLPLPAGVRRLTPRECERLMGWPEVAVQVIIDVCQYELPLSPARAAGLNLSVRSRAGIAGGDPRRESASSAEQGLPSSSRGSTKPADVHVEIDCEGGDIAIRTLLGQSFDVRSVEASALFGHLGSGVDSALVSALTSSVALRATQTGKAASPPLVTLSGLHPSGALSVAVSGREIGVAVADAQASISAARGRMKSTTSHHGRQHPSDDLILKTLCCFVVDAISGFIPELTQPGSSFIVRLSLRSGHTRYTADGCEIADSHRYRMAGNGVVATVAEWIGHRLVAVDAML